MPPVLSKRRGCRYWLKLLIVGVIGGLLIAYVAYVLISAEMLIQPARTSLGGITPAARGLAYADVIFTTSDGLTLKGWYLPSHNGAAIILLHGYGGNRLEMLDRAALLEKHGYGVLLYDERASGESSGDKRTFGWLDVNDVPLALAYLRTSVPIPEGVLPALPRIAPRPILFIATGQNDGRTLVKYFFERAVEPKQWWEVPETTHGGSPRARPGEYETVIANFLKDALAR